MAGVHSLDGLVEWVVLAQHDAVRVVVQNIANEPVVGNDGRYRAGAVRVRGVPTVVVE
jgi:hypothetical protein